MALALHHQRDMSRHRWLLFIPLIIFAAWLIEQLIVGGSSGSPR